VLWKDIFDRVDGFPRNGQIDSFELRQVLRQVWMRQHGQGQGAAGQDEAARAGAGGGRSG